MREKKLRVMAAYGSLLLSAIVVARLCIGGVLAPQVTSKAFALMLAQTLLLSGSIFLLQVRTAGLLRTAATLITVGLFCWLHQILLPLLVSGFFILGLLAEGAALRSLFTGKTSGKKASGKPAAAEKAFTEKSAGDRLSPAGEDRAGGLPADFLAGCLLQILLVCLLSAAGFGKNRHIAGGTLLLWGLSGGLLLLRGEAGELLRKAVLAKNPEKRGGRRNLWQAFCVTGILTAFCIQAGRMNIAIDYDSLWYGLRAPYVLNNGHGIYEDLGMVSVVYTYPKGFESLTLPLSLLPSYSFLLSFNLWMGAAAAGMTVRISRYIRRAADPLLLAASVLAVPGILNMGITAKADLFTLLLQLILLEGVLRYLQGEDGALWQALAAGIASYTGKPTAMAFSSALLGMTLIFLLKERKALHFADRLRPDGYSFTVFLLSLAVLGGIWARTWLLTGLPATSVFSGVFVRLGFRPRYPFTLHLETAAEEAAAFSLADTLKRLAGRICHMLLDPQGEDMLHVILAWGGPLMIAAVWQLATAAAGKRRRSLAGEETDRLSRAFLTFVTLPLTGCCLLSLALLYQVDGNYFMLLYVLLLLAAAPSDPENSVRLAGGKPAQGALILLSLWVMMLTNWSGKTGYSPLSPVHKGYYDHRAENAARFREAGETEIWKRLSYSQHIRVICMGEHPGTLLFPCVCQSYADITSSWGSSAIIRTREDFRQYLAYSGADYLYIQAKYVTYQTREWTLLLECMKYGMLVPEIYENGSVLCRVDPQGVRNAQTEADMETFAWTYDVAYAE